MKKNNMFHLVDPSPWPIISAINTQNLLLATTNFLKNKQTTTLTISIFLTSLSSILWWNTMKRESSLMGNHNQAMLNLFKISFLLFISSEILLFSSMFWNLLHNALSPTLSLGSYWPPNTINMANPYLFPTYGTLILLSSSAFITKAHFTISKENSQMNTVNKNLLKTIMLGILFLDMQMSEYTQSNLVLTTFNESSFSSIFFLTTSLHGSHVAIGIIFLTITSIFNMNMSISSKQHTSLELATWYWHFVDIIWLFVFSLVYWINL